MKTLTFPTPSRTTSRRPTTGKATVIPMPLPVVAPSAVVPTSSTTDKAARLTRLALVLHAAAAIGEVNPEMSIVDAVEEAEAMLAETPAAEEPTHAELTAMVNSLFPNVRH